MQGIIYYKRVLRCDASAEEKIASVASGYRWLTSLRASENVKLFF